MRPAREPVGPGQESVWDYPRPAVAERSDRHVRIIHRGTTVADTRAAIRTLETSHPPSWYLPPDDVARALLRDHLAFYAAPLDRCTVDGAVVTPQPGGFYGGWITADVVGPFKGVPGSTGW